VEATSSKPPAKTIRWSKNERFQELDGQRFLVFEFDGQKQTLTVVRWSKMDFFLKKSQDELLIAHLIISQTEHPHHKSASIRTDGYSRQVRSQK
jgi:hypothetical protein